MTEGMVIAIRFCNRLGAEAWTLTLNEHEPMLDNAAIGHPISHEQVLAISRFLRRREEERAASGSDYFKVAPSYHLETLLRGSKVYVEPPKPKAETTSEYKALMARLRRDEEARTYERMINPPNPKDAFSHHFPHSTQPHLFPTTTADIAEDDEITYADINRQMALIINILISVVACSVAIWIAAKHWSTPKRLGLSMGGSGMIGVAEVVVYAGYLRRLKEAKGKEKAKIEVKEVFDTWVIGGDENDHKTSPLQVVPAQKIEASGARRRKDASHD